MSQYEEDADKFAEHVYPCDDPYCQVCIEDEDEDIEDGMGWNGDEGQ